MKLPLVRRLKRIWLLALLAGSVGVGWFANRPSRTGPEYETAAVSRGKLTKVVTASGQLNPVLKVEVGSQISGIIQELLVDFNSTVKEGQAIAKIDSATYGASFIQAQGNLASAKAALELAQLNSTRSKTLSADKLIPRSEADQAEAALHQAEAAVKISEGALKKAEVELSRCTIYSPIDGIVISRDVNVGQTVAASLSAPKLFLIANDLAQMRIDAKVSEADIGSVEVGQKVNFTVDAFPGSTFPGQVTQVRNAPTDDPNQNVVTYDTIIDVKNPDLKLKPGMTANVTVIVAQRDNVLKVPNSAFRFRPPKGVEVKKPTGAEASDKSEKKSESAKSKKDTRKAERTVYVLRDGAIHSVQLKTGITDGRETELIEGLHETDALIIDLAESKEGSTLMSRLLATIKKKDSD